MAKFLIEVPHEGTVEACVRAIKHFMETGNHFMTHANWGCKDGVNKAWAVVDLDDKAEALHVVPPAYRTVATVVQLNEFKMEDVDDILSKHESQ